MSDINEDIHIEGTLFARSILYLRVPPMRGELTTLSRGIYLSLDVQIFIQVK